MKGLLGKIKLLLVLGYLAINMAKAYAGIGVSPQVIEFVIAPDKVGVGEYEVSNDGEEPIHVKVDPQDWLKKRLGLDTIPVEEWLTLTPMEFDVAPKSTEKVKFDIRIPSDYEGELAAMVFFEAQATNAGAFGVASRFGVSMYIAIEGTVNLDCIINDIKMTKRSDKDEDGEDPGQDLMFILDIQNKGNVHVRPTGEIKIEDENGNEYTVPIERGFPVYSGSAQDIMVLWKEANLTSGRYKGTATVDYGNIYSEDKKVDRDFEFIVDRDGNVEVKNQ